jgi:hypothetical protein
VSSPAKSRLDSGVLDSGVFNGKTSAAGGERWGSQRSEREKGSKGLRESALLEGEREGEGKMRVFMIWEESF